QLMTINPLDYPVQDVLSLDPKSARFYALGAPVRFIMDSEIDLGGHALTTAPFKHEMKGKYINSTLELSQQNGKVHYTADVLFVNRVLDATELVAYQDEMKQFAAVLDRSIVVQ